MVSHKYRCIFIHVPKVAGQSIETFFLQLHNLDWASRAPLLLRKNENPLIGPPRLAHLKSAEYAKFHYISENLFDEYFKFSFVRNPWSRAVSFYKYSNYHLVISFKTFVEKELPRLLNEQFWFYCPQYDFIYSEGEKQVNYLGRFETINEDFNEVCEQLEIPKTGLPYVNKSHKSGKSHNWKTTIKKLSQQRYLLSDYNRDSIKSKDYREYYDSSLIQQINDIYHKDVEAFNYTFEYAEHAGKYN